MPWLALDLEATIIIEVFDPRPRPGLEEFLRMAEGKFGRKNICIFSAAPEVYWRPLAEQLVRDGHAPAWLPGARYLRAEMLDDPPNWQPETELLPVKDLARVGELDQVVMVEDSLDMIPPSQRGRVITVAPFTGDGSDRELARIWPEIEKLLL